MTKEEHVVARESDIDDGERLIVDIKGRDVAIFNIDGEYYAYINWCAHQSGPCCEGRRTGTTDASFDRETLEQTLTYSREGEILNCPWHGWEYDITTGECLSRSGVRLPSFPVQADEGKIIVSF
jgi:nitrite reductase (NADH) small subunit